MAAGLLKESTVFGRSVNFFHFPLLLCACHTAVPETPNVSHRRIAPSVASTIDGPWAVEVAFSTNMVLVRKAHGRNGNLYQWLLQRKSYCSRDVCVKGRCASNFLKRGTSTNTRKHDIVYPPFSGGNIKQSPHLPIFTELI